MLDLQVRDKHSLHVCDALIMTLLSWPHAPPMPRTPQALHLAQNLI